MASKQLPNKNEKKDEVNPLRELYEETKPEGLDSATPTDKKMWEATHTYADFLESMLPDTDSKTLREEYEATRPEGWNHGMSSDALNKWEETHTYESFLEQKCSAHLSKSEPTEESTNGKDDKSADSYKDLTRYDITVMKRVASISSQEIDETQEDRDKKLNALDYYLSRQASGKDLDKLEADFKSRYPDMDYERMQSDAAELLDSYNDFKDGTKELAEKIKSGEAGEKDSEKFLDDYDKFFYASDMITADKYKELSGKDVTLDKFDMKKSTDYKLPENPKAGDYVKLISETVKTFVSNVSNKFGKSKERYDEARAELGDIVDSADGKEADKDAETDEPEK